MPTYHHTRLAPLLAVACLAAGACRGSAAASQAGTPELVAQTYAPGDRVAFSPDGRLFATVRERGAAVLWETATGRMLRELPPIERTLLVAEGNGAHRTMSFGAGSDGQDVVFSPDGRYVAAVPMSLKRAVNAGGWTVTPPAVWEVETGRPAVTAPWQLVDGVLRNDSAQWTASELIVWSSVRDGRAARRLASYRGKARTISADGRIGVLLESANGAGGDAWEASVRELPSDREVAHFGIRVRGDPVFALSRDGRLLAVKVDSAVDVWSVRRGTRASTMRLPRWVRSLAFSRDGRHLALAGGDAVAVYRTRGWSRVFETRIAEATQYGIGELVFSPDGRRLAATGDGFRMLEVPSGRVAFAQNHPKVASIAALALHDSVLAVAREPRFPDEVHATMTASVEVWPLGDGGSRRVLGDSLAAISALALSADGRRLAAATMELTTMSRYTRAYAGGLHVWRVPDGAPLYGESAEDGRPVSQAAFAADGMHLLALRYDAIPPTGDCAYVACAEDEATAYDVWLERVHVERGTVQRVAAIGRDHSDFDDAEGRARTLMLGPRGVRLLRLTARRRRVAARMLDAKTGRATHSFDGRALVGGTAGATPAECRREGGRGFLEFAPDESLIARASGQKIVVVDGRSGATVAAVDLAAAGAARKILLGRFTPDGALAVVTCRDREPGTRLERVDLASSAPRTLVRSPNVIGDVVFARSGRILLADGGVVNIYDAAGRKLASLVGGAGGDWLVTTPDGLYDASRNGAELAAWRVGPKLVSPDELPAEFRVPGLLPALMRGEERKAPPWPSRP